ncbi:MAG: zinc-binding dehydrogenase [Alphaproteobacteria bacterium]
MKAAVFRAFGPPEVLRLDEVPEPRPGEGQVLIKVLAAGVNRLDHYIREGAITTDLPLPHVLGSDIAGEVAEVGPSVSGLSVGERVLVAPGFPTDEADLYIHPASLAPSFTLPGLGRWGGYAQYVEAPARFVISDPTGLPPEEAATLPVVLATSVRAVKEVGQVARGDHVLVQAGASGSGGMQIQVAKALGAKVATTVRNKAKRDLAQSLGADLIIDPAATDVAESVLEWTGGRGADVVIDNLGGDVLAGSIASAKAGGAIVAYGFAAGAEVRFDVRDLFFKQRRLLGSMAADPSDFRWGLEQVQAGRIRPVLDRVLPLADAAEAHRLIAENQVRGNLVLLPWAA